MGPPTVEPGLRLLVLAALGFAEFMLPPPDGPDIFGELFASTRLQRFPLSPIDACHLRSGISKMEVIEEPLIFAVPHSVSTVNSLRSVAPVIESPFFMMTVVEASSEEANRTPATSPIGTLASPNAVRTGTVATSTIAPVIF